MRKQTDVIMEDDVRMLLRRPRIPGLEQYPRSDRDSKIGFTALHKVVSRKEGGENFSARSFTVVSGVE